MSVFDTFNVFVSGTTANHSGKSYSRKWYENTRGREYVQHTRRETEFCFKQQRILYFTFDYDYINYIILQWMFLILLEHINLQGPIVMAYFIIRDYFINSSEVIQNLRITCIYNIYIDQNTFINSWQCALFRDKLLMYIIIYSNM